MKISTIATTANNIKKPSKKDALTSLEKVILASGSDIQNDLAGLYAYFLTPKGRPESDSLAWVALARATKDVRFYLNKIYCDGDNIVGTDGYRIHIYPNKDNLPIGYYDDAGQIISNMSETRYPNYKQFIQSPSECTLLQDDFQNLRVEPNEFCKHVYIIGGHKYNKKYIDDTLRHGLQLKAYFSKTAQSLNILWSDGAIAVVMPMSD